MEKKENVNINVKVEEKETVKLFVEREKFTGNDGKEYYSYFLKGKVRGRDVRVDFAPKDKGGYEPLDIVFDVQDKAELTIGKEEMVDSNTGRKSVYDTYTVKTVDADGIEYVVGVKPTRNSDKALLQMLINTMKVKR